MRTNSRCIACVIGKQKKLIEQFDDTERKAEYIRRLEALLDARDGTESTPQLSERVDSLYREFWGSGEDYGPLKKKYNDLLLEKEASLDIQIRRTADPVRECIKYVCAANYIDFSAVENVSEGTFEKLLERAKGEEVSPLEYGYFVQDLERAQRLVYLTDNCGEIVLDKLFIKFIKEAYPKLDITVIVRGADVINDATMEDAVQVGLTDIVRCIGSGCAVPGTVMSRLSAEARAVLLGADVIISKGQGNFESLFGEGLNPYFMFLCKCEMFTERFGLEQYSAVFSKEERIE
ncbi:MAG: DUF89 family protein [Clostridia bacterium]|nr:DUF89 family protein [Clostridia bacterium]